MSRIIYPFFSSIQSKDQQGFILFAMAQWGVHPAPPCALLLALQMICYFRPLCESGVTRPFVRQHLHKVNK